MSGLPLRSDLFLRLSVQQTATFTLRPNSWTSLGQKSFLLSIDSQLYSCKRISPPPPTSTKSGFKLVCNVNIVYGNLKPENSQACVHGGFKLMSSRSGELGALTEWLAIWCPSECLGRLLYSICTVEPSLQWWPYIAVLKTLYPAVWSSPVQQC